MTMFQPFTCHECGGEVDYRSGPGRTYEYVEGRSIPIPDDFRLPTCDSCGEQYFTQDITDRLDRMAQEADMPINKLRQSFDILRECFGEHGVWADPSRYRRQCWTRDFGLAVQPLLLDLGDFGIAERHLRSLEKRQRSNGQIPIVFLDGLGGHVDFLASKAKESLRDGKLSFMLKRYLVGQLGQLTPGTRDSELLYIIAAYEYAEKTGKMPVSHESIMLAMHYIESNLLDNRGLLLGADWRDTMEKELGDKALLTNNALLCRAYDLMGKTNHKMAEFAKRQKQIVNEVFWDGRLLQDWPGNLSSGQRFDPLGASLAVLYDVIPPKRYEDVWDGFSSVGAADRNTVTIKCRHNPISPEEAEVIDRTDGVVVWPFVVGYAILAISHMAKKTGDSWYRIKMRSMFERLAELEGFREWYDPATNKGYGADRQLWSATLFARACNSLGIG